MPGFRFSTELTSLTSFVKNVVYSLRLPDEFDATALRIAKYNTTNLNRSNFKSVMLASLRSFVNDWG